MGYRDFLDLLYGGAYRREAMALEGELLELVVSIVKEMLMQLPPPEAQAIRMYFGLETHRVSIEEIAKKSGLDEKAVGAAIDRGMRRCRHPSLPSRLNDALKKATESDPTRKMKNRGWRNRTPGMYGK